MATPQTSRAQASYQDKLRQQANGWQTSCRGCTGRARRDALRGAACRDPAVLAQRQSRRSCPGTPDGREPSRFDEITNRSRKAPAAGGFLVVGSGTCPLLAKNLQSACHGTPQCMSGSATVRTQSPGNGHGPPSRLYLFGGLHLDRCRIRCPRGEGNRGWRLPVSDGFYLLTALHLCRTSTEKSPPSWRT